MQEDRNIPNDTKKNCRVLIVEDNLIGRKLLGFLLKKWGLSYDECVNGKMALENLIAYKYDLVLMDIQMPEMNGYETAKQIRYGMRMNVPIIAITAHSDEKEKKNCLLAGMNDYVCKPIIEDELYELMKKHIPKITPAQPFENQERSQ